MKAIKKENAPFKRARERRKLTQKELAEMLDISRIHVAKLEAGTRNPSVDLIRKIKKVLGEEAIMGFI